MGQNPPQSPKRALRICADAPAKALSPPIPRERAPMPAPQPENPALPVRIRRRKQTCGFSGRSGRRRLSGSPSRKRRTASQAPAPTFRAIRLCKRARAPAQFFRAPARRPAEPRVLRRRRRTFQTPPARFAGFREPDLPRESRKHSAHKKVSGCGRRISARKSPVRSLRRRKASVGKRQQNYLFEGVIHPPLFARGGAFVKNFEKKATKSLHKKFFGR